MNRITLNNNIQMPMLGFGTFLMGGSNVRKAFWLPSEAATA